MHDKVLILANSSLGLYHFRKELIEELIKNKEVVLGVPEFDMVDDFTKMGCRIIKTPMNRRGVNPVKDLRLIRNYLRLLKVEKPEIVMTYTVKPNVYGGLICRMLKIPYAANITGLGTAFQKPGLLKCFVIFLYKLSMKYAKVIFFENEENRQIFIDEKIVTSKQTCLLKGAGVNLEYFSVAEYPEQDKPVRFLFVGRVMKEKGIDELFDVMKQLYEEGYSVVLDVLGSCEEGCEETIKNCENEGWLCYHGYQTDVRPFIEKAHCFVLPSWHEGMANTNLECAAMARPLITSDIHGCKEAVIKDVSGYLCKKQDADSLYREMKKFINLDNNQRKYMGILGRKHMERTFDKKRVVEETIKKL